MPLQTAEGVGNDGGTEGQSDGEYATFMFEVWLLMLNEGDKGANRAWPLAVPRPTCAQRFLQRSCRSIQKNAWNTSLWTLASGQRPWYRRQWWTLKRKFTPDLSVYLIDSYRPLPLFFSRSAPSVFFELNEINSSSFVRYRWRYV